MIQELMLYKQLKFRCIVAVVHLGKYCRRFGEVSDRANGGASRSATDVLTIITDKLPDDSDLLLTAM